MFGKLFLFAVRLFLLSLGLVSEKIVNVASLTRSIYFVVPLKHFPPLVLKKYSTQI